METFRVRDVAKKRPLTLRIETVNFGNGQVL